MNEVDERTERLIVRQLDGELTPSEQDELNQILLRSAAARRMLSDYQQNDRLASDVIGTVAEGRWPSAAEPIRAGRSSARWVWGTLAAGLAAAAAIVIVLSLPRAVEPVGPADAPLQPGAVAEAHRSGVPADTLVYTSTDLPHHGERWVNRDYIGVLDESKDLLFIVEVDRTRTIRMPVAGDL